MSFKATKHKGLFYRSKDGAYQFIVTSDYKQHKKVLYNHTESTALQALRDFRKQINQKKSYITLDFLFDEHINLVEPFQALQTLRTKKSFYLKHISPRFGNLDLTALNYKDLQLFVNGLITQKLKPKTIKNIVSIIQTIYNYAIRVGYVNNNPASAVQIPKFDNARYFSLSNFQAKTFIETVKAIDDPFYRAFYLFLLHGRRLNEVKSITWRYINLTSGVYEIPAQINKARRNMIYIATPILIEALLNIRPESFNLDDYIFASPVTGLKLQDIRRSWQRLKIAWADRLSINVCELPYMRIHDIRHLIGDISINHLNKSIEKVAHTLGHTSISVTEKYVNRRSTSSKEVIEGFLSAELFKKNFNWHFSRM